MTLFSYLGFTLSHSGIFFILRPHRLCLYSWILFPPKHSGNTSNTGHWARHWLRSYPGSLCIFLLTILITQQLCHPPLTSFPWALQYIPTTKGVTASYHTCPSPSGFMEQLMPLHTTCSCCTVPNSEAPSTSSTLASTTCIGVLAFDQPLKPPLVWG